MPYKHLKMQMDKVRVFLHAMGACDYSFSGNSTTAKRKFRKIKRMAIKRCHYHGRHKPHGIEVYEAIYEAFNLRKYTLYGGYYWQDLRPLLYEENSENPYRMKKRRVTQEEFGSCRTWSLHGPVRKEYVMYCTWCGVTEGVSKQVHPGSKNKVVVPYCDKCHKRIQAMEDAKDKE